MHMKLWSLDNRAAVKFRFNNDIFSVSAKFIEGIEQFALCTLYFVQALVGVEFLKKCTPTINCISGNFSHLLLDVFFATTWKVVFMVLEINKCKEFFFIFHLAEQLKRKRNINRFDTMQSMNPRKCVHSN